MVTLTQLWIPILLSSVLVFVVSALIHMVFKWHNSDYGKLPDEDAIRSAIRAQGLKAGQYVFPHCLDGNDFKKPEVAQKFVEGPVGFLTLKEPGPPSMGKSLGLWFVVTLGVAVVVGYLASRTLPAGTTFLAVCRLVGIVTFLAYAVGSITSAVWMAKTASSTVKDVLDSFLYGLVSALVFAYFWPR
jgi:hypothetical protein